MKSVGGKTAVQSVEKQLTEVSFILEENDSSGQLMDYRNRDSHN